MKLIEPWMDEESFTVDDLVDRVDVFAESLRESAAFGGPVERMAANAAAYFSRTRGQEYNPGPSMIMAPLPLPGFSQRVPVVISLEMRSEDESAGFMFEYYPEEQYMIRAYHGTPEGVTQAAIVHKMNTGDFTFQIIENPEEPQDLKTKIKNLFRQEQEPTRSVDYLFRFSEPEIAEEAQKEIDEMDKEGKFECREARPYWCLSLLNMFTDEVTDYKGIDMEVPESRTLH